MTDLIVDCETDGLLDALTRVWTIQIGDASTDEATVYSDQPGYPPFSEAIERIRRARRVVMHNGLRFDFHVFNRFWPGCMRLDQVYDTMVVSRLVEPSERQHSLGAWGKRLGLHKGDHSDWTQFSQAMVEYGKQDIHVTRALYKRLDAIASLWGDSVELEFMVAFVVFLQEQNGFCLNQQKAIALDAELRQEMAEIEAELQKAFPPLQIETPFIPKRNDKSKGYVKGEVFMKKSVEVFNPGSRAHIGRRLMAKYGWKPKQWTSTGIPTIDEKVVAALKYPEARLMLRYLTIEKMLGQISDGKQGWMKVVRPNGRVHGVVNTNGAATGRMSHSKPNMAQVSKKDKRMREVWEPRPGWKLVGIDAEGLEARMLGHYLWPFDNGSFSDKVVNGKKEDGSDIHTSNLNACKPAGLFSRDGAKTILYALIYGGQDPKLGETVQEDRRNNGLAILKAPLRSIGGHIRTLIAKSMVGIDKLTKGVQNRFLAQKKYQIRGLDGRYITITSKHAALNYLLQGAGAIVMKKALVIWHFEEAPRLKLIHGEDFDYCANVHDEVQIECKPEIAELVGKTFAWCITEAGKRLGVRCPLAGDYAIGNNWKETH